MSHGVALSFKSSAGRVGSHTNGLALLLALVALTWTGAASASAWPRDPRVCGYSSRSQCAATAAKIAVKAKAGDSQITCTQGSTLLRWTCLWGTAAGGATPKTYRVAFSVKNSHWFVSVTP